MQMGSKEKKINPLLVNNPNQDMGHIGNILSQNEKHGKHHGCIIGYVYHTNPKKVNLLIEL